MDKKGKVTIEFDENSRDCLEARISEDGKLKVRLKNVLLILRPGKEPIYLGNMPSAWVEYLIEKGELIPYNPSMREK